ncbi:hypothetical protein HGRIS_006921 [Hohenbuehelia grisea]
MATQARASRSASHASATQFRTSRTQTHSIHTPPSVLGTRTPGHLLHDHPNRSSRLAAGLLRTTSVPLVPATGTVFAGETAATPSETAGALEAKAQIARHQRREVVLGVTLCAVLATVISVVLFVLFKMRQRAKQQADDGTPGQHRILPFFTWMRASSRRGSNKLQLVADPPPAASLMANTFWNPYEEKDQFRRGDVESVLSHCPTLPSYKTRE